MDAPVTATLTFVGTATTVLRLGPFTLLTDPNFVRKGQRVHLGYGLTSKRRTDHHGLGVARHGRQDDRPTR